MEALSVTMSGFLEAAAEVEALPDLELFAAPLRLGLDEIGVFGLDWIGLD